MHSNAGSITRAEETAVQDAGDVGVADASLSASSTAPLGVLVVVSALVVVSTSAAGAGAATSSGTPGLQRVVELIASGPSAGKPARSSHTDASKAGICAVSILSQFSADVHSL